MASRWPDVACDLWIIRDWKAGEALRSGAVLTCNAVLAEALDDEQAGYGLPSDYTCGPRLHVFADADCDVWLGCLDARWFSPGCVADWISRMVADPDMASAILEDGVYVLTLDGRSVTGCEVCHGTAAPR